MTWSSTGHGSLPVMSLLIGYILGAVEFLAAVMTELLLFAFNMQHISPEGMQNEAAGTQQLLTQKTQNFNILLSSIQFSSSEGN